MGAEWSKKKERSSGFPRRRATTLSPPDDRDAEDDFVYYTAIEGSGFRSLDEGEKVSYCLTRGKDRRTRADNVRKARKWPLRSLKVRLG